MQGFVRRGRLMCAVGYESIWDGKMIGILNLVTKNDY
jgi:cell fate regulator YaaT (PSP1 superfamily)